MINNMAVHTGSLQDHLSSAPKPSGWCVVRGLYCTTLYTLGIQPWAENPVLSHNHKFGGIPVYPFWDRFCIWRLLYVAVTHLSSSMAMEDYPFGSIIFQLEVPFINLWWFAMYALNHISPHLTTPSLATCPGGGSRVPRHAASWRRNCRPTSVGNIGMHQSHSKPMKMVV
jgi:hypothetical protein